MLTKWLSFPLLALATTGLLSAGTARESETSLKESLELRRIAEYWKERDYASTKLHIFDFLSQSPDSPHKDALYAMLGDLFYQEKNATEALRSYEKIEGKEFQQKCAFARLHCFYLTGNDEEVISLAPTLLKSPAATREDLYAVRFVLAEARYHKACKEETTARKKERFREALSEYLPLENTSYGEMTLLPLAQIYTVLEDYPKAASCYVRLAYKEADKKESFLFLAASFQLHFDATAAIHTFGKICELNGKHAAKAAFNQLNLLFQEKKYRDFILAHEKSGKQITAEQQPLIHYYLGKSLTQIEDYSKAIAPLALALASKKLDRFQEKNGLLATLACAKEMQNEELFENTLTQLKKSFPKDRETANALLMHTQLCSEKKDWAAVHSNIATILEYAPEHPERQALLYDDALAYMQEGKWQQGAESFEQLLSQTRQETHNASALRNYVQCRLRDAAQSSPEAENVKKGLLASAIGNALAEAKVFSAVERQKMRLQLAKTQFELADYEEAIGTLSQYVKDYPNDASSAHAYLMLAIAYKEGSKDDIHFTLNAERALAFSGKLPHADELHLTLYNTYLKLAAKAPEEEKAELIEKAADHLFLSLKHISDRKNIHWLAQFYYQQFRKNKSGALDKAAIVLETLLAIKDPADPIAIDARSMEKEAEVIRLAEIYGHAGRLQDQIRLLRGLTEQQKTSSDLPWKFQRMALFELGKSYVQNAQSQKGLEIYEEILETSPQTPSYFATAAKVEWAKLRFEMLSENEKREDAPLVTRICDALKEVQIQRKLYSEPLHLEAALDYVALKTTLAPQETREERSCFLLSQLKENYASECDPLVEQYLSAKEQFPEKERLFRQYMEYIDVEVDRLQALQTHNLTQWDALRQRLNTLKTHVAEESLKTRIESSTKALEKML